jgi:hypothetical protein
MIWQKFTIPIKGLSRQRAEEQIGQLIHDYSEEVEWDDTLGTLSINGSKHLHYNKQIWFPEGDAGTPGFEIVKQEGHDLNDETMLKWFHQGLKRASKIPLTRFEGDSGGGNLITDAAEMTRDEIKFHNFISRLRANFKEIIVKPLKLQMLIEFPELKDDEVFVNSVDIIFYTNQIFEEWKKINNLAKRAEAVTTLTGIMNGEQPYFHIEWIMDNVFKLTPEEKTENQRYWAKDAANKAAAAGAAAVPGAEGGEMPAEGGEAPAEGGGEAPAEGGEAQAAPEAPAEGGGEAPAEGGEFEF